MIELETQFQIVISSIVFGMVFTNLYTFFDIILGKSKVIRAIIELCFFLVSGVLYYYLIFVINKGVLNIYMPICLLMGYIVYKRYYDKYFSCLYKYLFSVFHSIIKNRKERCLKRWKELIVKITKKAKSTE